MVTIGAHVSTAGGLVKSLERATDLGIEAMQIFASSPQSWARRPIAAEEVVAFREGLVASNLKSVWIHGCYLMNFASQNPAALRQSVDCLIADLKTANAIGAKGVIFHTGSHGGRGLADSLANLVSSLTEVYEQSPKNTLIVLENAAGSGGAIGKTFEELGEILSHLPSDRFRICLDTQHTFAAGYAIHENEGLTNALDAFDTTIGLERLVALHANDSKMPLGSYRDRHENIGDGLMGESSFQLLTHHPVLKNIPFILEVPGIDGKSGPDKANVERLRKIAR